MNRSGLLLAILEWTRFRRFCRPESGCLATRLSYLPLDSVTNSLLRTPAPIYSLFLS